MFAPQRGRAEAAKWDESGNGLGLLILPALQALRDAEAELDTAWEVEADVALERRITSRTLTMRSRLPRLPTHNWKAGNGMRAGITSRGPTGFFFVVVLLYFHGRFTWATGLAGLLAEAGVDLIGAFNDPELQCSTIVASWACS